MKVLCIADHIDPVIYSANLKGRFSDIDLVLSAGDLALEYYDFIVSTLNKPLLFVFGNHQLEGLLHRLDPFGVALSAWELGVGAMDVEGRVTCVKGLIVAGLGGSIWYNGGDNQYTDFGMFLRILRLMPGMLWNRIIRGRFIDILLTHSPPYGINDLPDASHTGFRVFLWFMRHFRPAYLVHGHVHLYDRNAAREAKYADTTVVNAYDHAVLSLEISR
ncbi:MAG TPA: metallophosphoesterase [Spirochaetia bacterium]|nr:metallophosphoesterase [Spirochaetia bacterium]